MTLPSACLTLSRVAESFAYRPILTAALGIFSAAFGLLTVAQESKPVERVYSCSQADVQKTLEDLQAFETARLPVLAGFVNAKANTLKDFDNPHYQFQIEVLAQGSGHTLVQVQAKITAWYVGADAARSQYALIPSNGRLEEELLDRLSVLLEKGNTRHSAEPAPTPATAPADDSSTSRPPINAAGFVPTRPDNSAPPAPEETVAPLATSKTSDPAKLASQIAETQSALQAVGQKKRQSEQQIAELDATAKSRQRITDFAIAKKAQTPVFEAPNALSKILFHADAEDEFEVLEARDGWVRVRVENSGPAWLQIFELELPGQSNVSDDFGAQNFSVANEVIQTFTGDWSELKGKSALFVLAQPKATLPGDILGKSRLEFAAHTFLEGYRVATHSQQTIAGVVVVFTGDKPGVAAATLPEIRRWQDGRLSDKLFFARCSLDPPDSFRDSSNH